jgi:hypothetical protein
MIIALLPAAASISRLPPFSSRLSRHIRSHFGLPLVQGSFAQRLGADFLDVDGTFDAEGELCSCRKWSAPAATRSR